MGQWIQMRTKSPAFVSTMNAIKIVSKSMFSNNFSSNIGDMLLSRPRHSQKTCGPISCIVCALLSLFQKQISLLFWSKWVEPLWPHDRKLSKLVSMMRLKICRRWSNISMQNAACSWQHIGAVSMANVFRNRTCRFLCKFHWAWFLAAMATSFFWLSWITRSITSTKAQTSECKRNVEINTYKAVKTIVEYVSSNSE